jgi:hypothetical protein
MYSKPTVQRFGSFRDLTQVGCFNVTDGISIVGIGTAVGNVPEIVKGANGKLTTKVCFAFVSGF